MKRFLFKKRSIIGVLAGILISLLLTMLFSSAGTGLLLGLVAALMIADVATPKEGAIIGALVPIPAAIYAFIYLSQLNFQQSNVDWPAKLLYSILGLAMSILLMALVGVVIGLGIGKFFEMRRKGHTIFF